MGGYLNFHSEYYDRAPWRHMTKNQLKNNLDAYYPLTLIYYI